MRTIIKRFCEHGTLIEPDAIEYINQKEKPEEFADFLHQNLKEYPLILTLSTIHDIEQTISNTFLTDESIKPPNKTITPELLQKVFNPEVTINPEQRDDDTDIDANSDEIASTTTEIPKPLKEIKSGHSWNPIAKEYSSDVQILKDITGKSICNGTTEDFAKLFKNRHEVLRKIIISQRREMTNVIPVKRINKDVSEVHLIGIVAKVRTTTNGHKLIEIEDETGSITIMALKNNTETFAQASEVVIDEIIGIRGKFSKNKDLLLANQFIFPDIRLRQQINHASIPIFAAFLSDIHIGSTMFMQNEWNTFLKWINGNLGNSRQRSVASKIKYLILPGDLVDGIGIYPNQEKELSTPNIYKQYEELSHQLSLIPDHITIIMQPGNHDAVRPAEPQPTFEKEIRELFTGKEYKFIGNPCYFRLHGVEILSYHGQSLLDFATNIQSIHYNHPTDAMKIMLRKRHLAPVYGGYTPLSPEHLDYMIIDTVPDIFVTGHVHTANITKYRDVTLINASSWQSQTSYQKMLNFVPDSAKLPIVDLQTGNATTMDFSQNIS